MAWALKRVISQYHKEWDLVLLYEPAIINQIAYLLCRRFGIPMALRMTGRMDLAFQEGHRQNGPLKGVVSNAYSWWLRRAEAYLARRILTITDGQLGFLGPNPQKHRAVFCLESVMRAEEFPSTWSPPVWHRGAEPFRVLSLSRVHPQKGIHHLVEACALVNRHNIDIRLDIVGPIYDGALGAYATQLREQIATLSIERSVHLQGFVEQSQLQELWGSAHALVVPCVSNGDGVPKVIMEAMARGVPVVATRVGGIPNVIRDGENGLLIEPGDVQALTGSLERLATSPDLHMELSRKASEQSSEFAAEAVAEKFATLVRGALSSTSTGDGSTRDR